MTDLGDLNAKVTQAILRAEALPGGTAEARAAFQEVSLLEEEIAKLMPSDDLEGSIARRGAITASLSAGDPVRALRLAEQYLAEQPAADLAEELRELRDLATSIGGGEE